MNPPGWIGKHLKHVILGFAGRLVDPKAIFFIPNFLPLFFDIFGPVTFFHIQIASVQGSMFKVQGSTFSKLRSKYFELLNIEP
jgi:hypothetical protein